MNIFHSIILFLFIFLSAHGFIVQEPTQNASVHDMYITLKREIASLDTEFVGLESKFAILKADSVNLTRTFDNLTNIYESFRKELVNVSKDNSRQQNEMLNIAQQLSPLQTAVTNLTSAYKQTEQQFSNLVYQFSQLNEKLENQSNSIYSENLGPSQSNHSVSEATNNTVNGKRRVGFSVSMPEKATIGRDGPLKFTNPIYNDNDAFNFTTAQFHCRIPGLYFFSSTIIRETGGYPESFCYLMINDFAKAYLGAYSFKASYGNPSGMATILYHMQEGDTAYVGMCGVIRQISKYSNFNGFLINED